MTRSLLTLPPSLWASSDFSGWASSIALSERAALREAQLWSRRESEMTVNSLSVCSAVAAWGVVFWSSYFAHTFCWSPVSPARSDSMLSVQEPKEWVVAAMDSQGGLGQALCRLPFWRLSWYGCSWLHASVWTVRVTLGTTVTFYHPEEGCSKCLHSECVHPDHSSSTHLNYVHTSVTLVTWADLVIEA